MKREEIMREAEALEDYVAEVGIPDESFIHRLNRLVQAYVNYIADCMNPISDAEPLFIALAATLIRESMDQVTDGRAGQFADTAKPLFRHTTVRAEQGSPLYDAIRAMNGDFGDTNE